MEMNILAKVTEEIVNISAMVYRHSCLPYVLAFPYCIIALLVCVCFYTIQYYTCVYMCVFLYCTIIAFVCMFLYCIILHLCVYVCVFPYYSILYSCLGVYACAFISMWVHVCLWECLCEHTWMVIRGQYCVFLYHCPLYYLWPPLSLNLEFTDSARVADQQAQDPPVSAPALGLQMHTTEPGLFIMWMLRIWPQDLVLVQQALHPLSNLPSPTILCFYTAICLPWWGQYSQLPGWPQAAHLISLDDMQEQPGW